MQTVPYASIGVGGIPEAPEGQRVIGPFLFTFTNSAPIAVNLRAQMENSLLISFGKTIYVDQSQNPNPVLVNFANHTMLIKGNTQGWYPIISQRPIQFQISCAAAAGFSQLWIANYDISPAQWATV